MKRICLILALLICFCACQKEEPPTLDVGKNEEPFTLDVSAAAEKIATELEFYDELTLIDDEMASSLLAFGETLDAKIAMYVGSGASADSVIVAKGAILDVIEAYLDAQEQMYASYMAGEAEKIKNAVLETKDDYIIVVVTDDKNASKLVGEILK